MRWLFSQQGIQPNRYTGASCPVGQAQRKLQYKGCTKYVVHGTTKRVMPGRKGIAIEKCELVLEQEDI
jgi:O-acetyl-ADP-ribose deacetylase (regulator of RNase III)